MAKPKNKTTEGATGTTDAPKVASKKETVENPTVKRQRIANELRAKRAKEIEAANAKKAAAEKAAKSKSEQAVDKKETKDTRKQFTDDRGLKYAFKNNAPKALNIDGKSTPTEDLVENKEVMLELVYGNSNYIEQIR